MDVEMIEESDLKWDWDDEEARLGGDWLLIGKLFTPKIMNRGAFETLIRRAWSLKGNAEINSAGNNLYFFVFAQQKDYERVLRDSPWTISGNLLNLQRWSPLLTVDEVDMKRCPFWVQIHNLPRAAMTKRNILRMGEKLGEVICFEDPKLNESVFRSFVRIRVNIDVTKPLVAGFWVPRPGLEKVWAEIRYEKLQSFCYTCGIVGHDMNDCGLEQVMAEHDPLQPMYQAGLGVRPMRAVAAIIRIEGGLGGHVEVEVVKESSSSKQSMGDSLMSSAGGSQGSRKNSQLADHMDISVSNKEVGETGLEFNKDEEEVESPVKVKQAVVVKEAGGQENQPIELQFTNEKVALDAVMKEKQGFSHCKGKEVVLARHPLSLVDANSSNNTLLVDGGKESKLAVRRVLFREGLKWKERFQHEPYFVELPSDEDSTDLSILPLVKAKKYEGLLVEELEKVSLKRKVEEEQELSNAKRLKDMEENQGSKEEVEKKKKVGRPKKHLGKMRLHPSKLVEVPVFETKSGSRFDILAALPEDYVFSADGRSGGRPTTTTQEP